MIASLISFGLLFGCLASILIGIFGANRRIGFGWSFILSLLFTPIIGLICVLISQPLPNGERKWGCIAYLIMFGAIATLVLFLLTLIAFIGSI